MFEYELHQIRSAELILEAEQYRRTREVRRARREAAHASTVTARSASGVPAASGESERDAEERPPRERIRRPRFPRAV
ncbi:hypothetical protein [Streptomyces sp. NPDC012510]|uniref:hypothetical protein n=1 Tax=Streptomyces sp. NPDC012510 TaxID=3364838 RepID=UPI0036E49133